MHPYLVDFKIGKLPILVTTYSVLAIAAIMVTGLLYIFFLPDGRKKVVSHIIFLSIVLVSSLVGSRVVQFLLDLWINRGTDVDVMSVLRNTGGTVSGGLIFALIAVAIYAKLDPHRIMNWQTLDTLAMAFPFGHMLGRFGCVSAGCCYGKISHDAALTLNYPENWPVDVFTPEAIPHGPRIASPLIAAIGLFCIGVILLVLLKSSKTRGHVSAAYFIMYGVFRFFQEKTRGDLRAFFGPFSAGQWFGIIATILGIVLLGLYIRRLVKGTAGPPFLPFNGKEPKETDVFEDTPAKEKS
jgi:phosphatidylglycerol---prolipoprotein diacylglyceryl transferase